MSKKKSRLLPHTLPCPVIKRSESRDSSQHLRAQRPPNGPIESEGLHDRILTRPDESEVKPGETIWGDAAAAEARRVEAERVAARRATRERSKLRRRIEWLIREIGGNEAAATLAQAIGGHEALKGTDLARIEGVLSAALEEQAKVAPGEVRERLKGAWTIERAEASLKAARSEKAGIAPLGPKQSDWIPKGGVRPSFAGAKQARREARAAELHGREWDNRQAARAEALAEENARAEERGAPTRLR